MQLLSKKRLSRLGLASTAQQRDWAGVGDFDGDRRMDVAWSESWNNTSVSVGLAR